VLVDSIDCYNPDTDSWKTVTRVPTPRYHAGIVALRSKIYFIGGFHSDAMFDRATGMFVNFDLFLFIFLKEHRLYYKKDIYNVSPYTIY
jgi:kelch-like protein 26